MVLWVQVYLLWNVFSILRGVFIAENYWDWKTLVGNGIALMVPLVAYAATNASLLQSILKIYTKYALPFFVIIAFMIDNGAYGIYLVPISFLALFLPIIKKPWRSMVLVLALLVIFVDFSARSNVIKFGVPIVLSLIYYLRLVLSVKILEFIRKLLFVVPLLFFVLAVNEVFNVFNMDQYIKGNYIEVKKNASGEITEDKLTTDTRTGLYIEVLQTAVKYDSWFIGRSPARGNETELFASLSEITGRRERASNEVAILNIFTWTGIVGVLLYMIVFYKATYIAINQSNNIFSKILGLFVAFRWVYAWVEDINNFSLATFFLWFMIGLCFSKTFRSMSNKEVAYWVRGIFEYQKPSGVRKKFFNTINNQSI